MNYLFSPLIIEPFVTYLKLGSMFILGNITNQLFLSVKNDVITDRWFKLVKKLKRVSVNKTFSKVRLTDVVMKNKGTTTTDFTSVVKQVVVPKKPFMQLAHLLTDEPKQMVKFDKKALAKLQTPPQVPIPQGKVIQHPSKGKDKSVAIETDDVIDLNPQVPLGKKGKKKDITQSEYDQMFAAMQHMMKGRALGCNLVASTY